jgi:hypothetical protein
MEYPREGLYLFHHPDIASCLSHGEDDFIARDAKPDRPGVLIPD